MVAVEVMVTRAALDIAISERSWAAAVSAAICRGARIVGVLLALCPGFPLVAFEPLLPAQIATILKHVSRIWMQSPKAPLAGLIRRARHLEKTIIEAERMSNGILPSLLILSVIGEQVHDELINFTKGQHFARGILDRHRDERNIGVGRLCVRVTSTIGFVRARSLQQGTGTVHTRRIVGRRGRGVEVAS